MITLQMVYFNRLDEHGKVVERRQQPMNEEFKSKKELDGLRVKLENAFIADGKDVDVRFQYLMVEDM